VPDSLTKLALSIPDLIEGSGLGRTFIYEEINAGRLIVRKAGRRTIVLDADARAWLASFPTLSPGGK
jgi:hypothetical protein